MSSVLSDVLLWTLSVLHHWAVLVTGGVITAIITALQWQKQKSIPWTVARRIMVGFLFVAFFLAWREEHEKVIQSTRATLDKHTHLDFLLPTSIPLDKKEKPFQVGHLARANMGIFNTGQYTAIDSTLRGSYEYLEDSNSAERDFEQVIGKAKSMACGTLHEHSPAACWRTFSTESPLTVEQVAKLNDGHGYLCLFGRSHWNDESGQYHFDLLNCYHNQGEPDSFNWEIPLNIKHNKEVKE